MIFALMLTLELLLIHFVTFMSGLPLSLATGRLSTLIFLTFVLLLLGSVLIFQNPDHRLFWFEEGLVVAGEP